MSETFREKSTYIAQGEQAIGDNPNDLISTTLGSCVAVCLWDPSARVGGMNHILLPDSENWAALSNFGGSAMDRLVNEMLKAGARRSELRAKVFGGAAMIAGLSNIGARNAEFVRNYLERESIPCDAESTGGTSARQIKYWPYEGRARQRFVDKFNEPKPAETVKESNSVELF